MLTFASSHASAGIVQQISEIALTADDALCRANCTQQRIITTFGRASGAAVGELRIWAA